MNAPVLPMLTVVILALGLIAWLLLQPRWQQRRRARQLSTPLPDAWQRILNERVPLYRRMPADLQQQLAGHIRVFLAEKAFIGCQGQRITDEVRVTIAAQACLLLLNRPTHYYPHLRQVLVYPSAFLVNRTQMDEHGVVHHWRDVLSGESWDDGQVILAWDETRRGTDHPDDAYNVVLHEFAHQLDSETGATTGTPLWPGSPGEARWQAVMQRAYAELQARTERGEATLLDPYGASDPVEFFAVLTETFFELPDELAHEHPDVYQELARLYRVDPASWPDSQPDMVQTDTHQPDRRNR